MGALRDAIEYWSKLGDEGEDTLAQVLRVAAKLDLQDSAFAAEVYKLYLEKIDGSDTEALCGLVQALASSDPERADQYAQRLQVPSYDHLDPEELEMAPIPKIDKIARRTKEADKENQQTDQDEEDGDT